jgi:aspartate racemase
MSTQDKIVGVLGGMGPDATVDFMAKVIAATPADGDQDHIRMLVDHNPTVPNRQAAILEDGENPGPALAAMAAGLEKAGADFLVIPCNTAYVFERSILDATSIPLISIIDVTVDEIMHRVPGVDAAGVLATDGCLQAGVFQDAMAAKGIRPVLPDASELAGLMDLVYRVKAGDQGDDVKASMRALAAALEDRGAQAVVAGCTEIPLVLDEAMLSVPLIASTDVLAQYTVALARGEQPLPAQES